MSSIQNNILHVPNDSIQKVKLNSYKDKMQVLVAFEEKIIDIRFAIIYYEENEEVMGKILVKKNEDIATLYDGYLEGATEAWYKITKSFLMIAQENDFLRNDGFEEQINSLDILSSQQKKQYEPLQNNSEQTIILENNINKIDNQDFLSDSSDKKSYKNNMVPLGAGVIFLGLLIGGYTFLMPTSQNNNHSSLISNVINNSNPLSTPNPVLVKQIENYNVTHNKVDPGYRDVVTTPVSLENMQSNSGVTIDNMQALQGYLKTLPPDELVSVKKTIANLAVVAKDGTKVTPDMLSSLPDPVKKYVSTMINKGQNEVATSDNIITLSPQQIANSKTDKYGNYDVPTQNNWVNTNNMVVLPLPGAGNLSGFDQFKSFGLQD